MTGYKPAAACISILAALAIAPAAWAKDPGKAKKKSASKSGKPAAPLVIYTPDVAEPVITDPAVRPGEPKAPVVFVSTSTESGKQVAKGGIVLTIKEKNQTLTPAPPPPSAHD